MYLCSVTIVLRQKLRKGGLKYCLFDLREFETAAFSGWGRIMSQKSTELA